MIKVARNASNKLKGIAANRMPVGNTPIFPITTHINTKPTNHESRVVCNKVNFLAIIKIEIANNSDQIPQSTPLIGSVGKTSPKEL